MSVSSQSKIGSKEKLTTPQAQNPALNLPQSDFNSSHITQKSVQNFAFYLSNAKELEWLPFLSRNHPITTSIKSIKNWRASSCSIGISIQAYFLFHTHMKSQAPATLSHKIILKMCLICALKIIAPSIRKLKTIPLKDGLLYPGPVSTDSHFPCLDQKKKKTKSKTFIAT